MVSHYHIKTLLLSIIFLMACDKDQNKLNCDDCLIHQPVNISLEIAFDSYSGGMYREPEIKVYEGIIEDSILIATRTALSNPVYIPVYINKKYTVTATYFYYGRTYVVVDSVEPEVLFDNDKCDRPCYFIKNNILNLKLGYT